MISNRLLQDCLEDFADILRMPMALYDQNGNCAAGEEPEPPDARTFESFSCSAADMQALGSRCLFKIGGDHGYILSVNGSGKDVYPMGQLAVRQLERLLDMVGLSRNVLGRYPHEFSGGMRQRVGIAMGMTYQPKLLLADEPTSALDVTTQAQIIRQFMELREEYGTSIIMVTHNLGVAAYMSDYIVVMKDGIIEDEGTRDYILKGTRKEYTKTLLDAVPSLGGVRYV